MARFWSQKEGLYDRENDERCCIKIVNILTTDLADHIFFVQWFPRYRFIIKSEREKKYQDKTWAIANSSNNNMGVMRYYQSKGLLASESLWYLYRELQFHFSRYYYIISFKKNPSKSNEWTRSQCSKMPQGITKNKWTYTWAVFVCDIEAFYKKNPESRRFQSKKHFVVNFTRKTNKPNHHSFFSRLKKNARKPNKVFTVKIR